MAAWILYFAALSAAVALAALAAEKALLMYRRPVRWTWAAALLLSLALPAAAWLAPGAPGPGAGRLAVAPAERVDPAALGGGAAKGVRWSLPPLDGPLQLAWGAASGGTLLVLGGLHLAMLRRRRAWRRETVEGVPVLVSPDTGPAVIGFARGSIVLPEWVLASDGATRGLVLAHEQEHVRAGDTRLLLLALATVCIAPWNPALWWQLRRLRLAVEVDCDARVLRARGTVREYGTVLLELGRRVSTGALGAAAFSEPTSFLERRIRIMTSTTVRARVARTAGFAALALLCAAAASATPRPAPFVLADAAADTVPGNPSKAEIRALVAQRFPSVLTQGMQGKTVIAFEVDSLGAVTHAGMGATLSDALAPGRSATAPATDVTSMAVLTFAAGELGPDAVRVAYIATKSAADAAREAAARREQAALRPAVVAAVDRYFPSVRASGTPAKLYFVVDNTGIVVRSGAMESPNALSDLNPNLIERVDVVKSPASQIGGHPVQIVWIVLKAGRTLPTR
ncbi:MAG TPA: M56 family metallopeptidase [Longimicrobiaceae bacterium]|nr:M56 family metallopeptidase [Longimicrobiaceae bacterium]